VEYQVDGRPGQDAETVTLELYDRNALRWDDNRKVAAFVTAKDDEVQRFAKNSASLEQQGRRDALSTNLQLAMVMLAALKEHGLTYVVDPKSSYRELSANKAAVDYIQFPRQTLQFKGGDCDDLSVAFCALLEAVGVPTAFITVPGHIFPAFQLDQDAKEASRAFSNPDDLIIAKDTTVWIPVEVTILQEGFLQAWAAGAREWREQIPAGRAGFWRTAEAWETYQPVAFTVGSFQITTPAEAQVRASFEEEMQKLVASEIRERQQTLLAALQLAPDDARSRNELGVLYARYGLEEEARGQFTRIIAQREYAPALLNLGLLLFLHGRVEEATGYFERAVRADSQSAPALLALTRAYHAQENYGMARRYYDQLARVDAGLAERFAYLKLQGAEAGRAADAARLTRLLVWGE
jgi:tetratricopeptide (TPR) repeat protein